MAEAADTLVVRDLVPGDVVEVVRIDAAHTGVDNHGYWNRVFQGFVGPRAKTSSFGIAADAGSSRIAGYLFGEVRAFEFGAEPAGWVFAVGVEPELQRQGVARALLDEASRRFAALGVRHVRTMVRRNDVSILSFFRTAGFVGGPFVQLEFEIEDDT